MGFSPLNRTAEAGNHHRLHEASGALRLDMCLSVGGHF